MAVNCEFVAQDWNGIIPALLTRRYDVVIASMAITEARRKKVAFTDRYYQTPARFMTCGTAPEAATPEALAGRIIGAQAATTHADYLEGVYTGSTIKLYRTQEQAHLDLKSGRLDAVLADSVVLLAWHRDQGRGCTFFGADVVDPAYFGEGAGIALRKEDTELQARLNTALQAIIADGTYEKINRNYFPFSIY